MTKRFAADTSFGAQQSASCGATFKAGSSSLVIVLGIALAMSIIICGIIGIVRLLSLSLVVLISLLVRSTPPRLRTVA